MTQQDIAIVFDCGATNIRVIAINTSGKILAAFALPNETDEDPHWPGGRIWDVNKLWDKFCEASGKVTAQIDKNRIAGITVTTFGVDGTFVDQNGNMLYPVISWQCQRTQEVMKHIDKYLPLSALYNISGVYPYAFNTINKLVWFKENKPEVIGKAYRFLFISSLLVHKLSGVMMNDTTMLGTGMIADLKNRQLSEKTLKTLGMTDSLFNPIAEPGQQAGPITSEAAAATGLPQGIPVVLTGHDTQFAIFGSGAGLNQPVLSSGTWEILMTRSQSFKANELQLKNFITTEADAIPGYYDIGQNWLGSGILEWFANHFYAGLSGDDLYRTMIADAELEQPGSGGITINPSFYDDGSRDDTGSIHGLTISTRRGQVYRAFLESLAYRLREGKETLERAGDFKSEKIICVGGGSKNRLWNQLRADVCNIPIHIIDQKETTVLGASLFVFAGTGVFKSVHEAQKNIPYNQQIIEPSQNSNIYDQLFCNYSKFKKN